MPHEPAPRSVIGARSVACFSGNAMQCSPGAQVAAPLIRDQLTPMRVDSVMDRLEQAIEVHRWQQELGKPLG